MLPNFLIIGAPKAASTWLADCLRDHPDVFMAEIKEIRFFSRHYDKGLEWYATHFADWAGEKAVGEATPGYIDGPDVPERIKETLGDVKLIASLRHPVDRAYSAFWHYASRGVIPLEADFRAHFAETLHKTGHYYAHLNRYFEMFPRESILVMIYEEDIAKNPKMGIASCLKFLDVDPNLIPDTVNRRSNKAREISVFHDQGWKLRRTLDAVPEPLRKPLVAAGKWAFKWSPKKQKDYTPLDKGLRQKLFDEYYLSEIEQLERLLDRDLSVWYDSPHLARQVSNSDEISNTAIRQ